MTDDRTLDATQLAYMRAHRQASELFLWIDNPPAVFKAHIASTPTSLDGVYQISYDRVAAPYDDYTTALPDMTLWIGTGAGLSNIGIARIRAGSTNAILNIGIESGFNLAIDQYLTVVDEYLPVAKHLKSQTDETVKMDYDVAYTDQHVNYEPVPVLGSDVVQWIYDDDIVIDFDSSGSWVPDSTISTDHWTSDGGTLGDHTTDTPTLTVSAAGRYRVNDLVTAANAKSKTGHRLVRVFSSADMPITQFELTGNPRGDYSSGGWEFSVKLYAEADLTAVRDGAKVVLWARDYYGQTLISMGPEPGRENKVCEGWIAGETIEVNPDDGSVTFDVKGAAWWLSRTPGDFINLENTTTAVWTTIQNLTVLKAVHHIAAWQSTITTMMDLRCTTDTRQAMSFDLGDESIWDQLARITERIYAAPVCDRQGRLRIEIEANMIPLASRSFDTVMEITKADWLDVLLINRNNIEQFARVDLVGSMTSGGSSASIYSLATGHVPLRYGNKITAMSMVMVASQAQSNQLAGLLLGRENNEIGMDIKLACNNRVFDICPNQYAHINIVAGDSPRGYAYHGNLFVKSMELSFDSGVILTNITTVGETFEQLSCNGDIPAVSVFDDGEEIYPKFKLDKLPKIAPIVGGSSDTYLTDEPPSRVLSHDVNHGMFYTSNFNELDPTLIKWAQSNWGLTDTVYKAVSMMVMTSAGGVYVSDGLKVYYATSPTSAYEVIYDTADFANTFAFLLTNPGGYDYSPFYNYSWTIQGMGRNKGSNEIGFMACTGTLMYFVYGTKGNWTTIRQGSAGEGWAPGYGGLPTAALGLMSYVGAISYGSGKWAISYEGSGGIQHGYVMSFGAGGTNYSNVASDSQNSVDYHYRLGSGSSGYLLIPSGLNFSSDNFITLDVVSATPAATKRFAADITGQYLIGVDDVDMFKSTDGGSSWSAALSKPLSSIQLASNQFCVDKDRWIVIGKANSAAYTPIIYTPDHGTTWETRYGNLTALFPSTVLSWNLLQALP